MKNDPDGHAASPDEQRAPKVSRRKFRAAPGAGHDFFNDTRAQADNKE